VLSKEALDAKARLVSWPVGSFKRALRQ